MMNGEPLPVGGLTALKEALRRVGVETLPSRLEQAPNAGDNPGVTGRVVGVTRRVHRKIGYGGFSLSFELPDPRLVERVAEDLGTSRGSMPARLSFAARSQKMLINNPLCFNVVVRWATMARVRCRR
jgi:hypothetical protein